MIDFLADVDGVIILESFEPYTRPFLQGEANRMYRRDGFLLLPLPEEVEGIWCDGYAYRAADTRQFQCRFEGSCKRLLVYRHGIQVQYTVEM